MRGSDLQRAEIYNNQIRELGVKKYTLFPVQQDRETADQGKMLEVIDKCHKFLMLVLKVPAPSHHTEDVLALLSSHSHSCSYSKVATTLDTDSRAVFS